MALDPPAPSPEGDPEIPVDRLDPDALKVISRLRHVGHQAYLVGGCVRDLLLGRTPKDFDVATDAHPGEVRAVFRNCRLIGRRFRLAHVYFRGGKVIEVATFRSNPAESMDESADESDLLITRDNVFGTTEEDARRRDFTVNGLFYDTFAGRVIDYVGGRNDLESHRIATIGTPEIRMREDPVRALRAVRFAARLGFTIAPDTFAAMRRHSGELARCAPPRVLEEIFKILRCGQSARAFELLRASGALPILLPPLAAVLETANDEGRRRFTAHLAALDKLVRSGEEVSEAVLLGALLTHVSLARTLASQPDSAEPTPDGGESIQDDPGDAAQGLLAGLVQTARLPRKVAERTKLALNAQRMFGGPPRKRRRRRGGISGQAYFQDALQLLQITVEATGEGQEELERWKRFAAGEPLSEPSRPPREAPRAEPTKEEPEAQEAQPSGDAEGQAGAHSEGHKRRRRRGGRRRRRRGGAGAEGPKTAEPKA
jgi:poly(A) polymerase